MAVVLAFYSSLSKKKKKFGKVIKALLSKFNYTWRVEWAVTSADLILLHFPFRLVAAAGSKHEFVNLASGINRKNISL